MEHPVSSTIHCINPNCPKPDGQLWGNKFCQNCGAPLQLNHRYIPLRCLGSGGFSKLYTVWDPKTQSEKVLKVLVEPSPKALELFEQEAAVLAHLHHSGVPRVAPDGYFFLRRRHANRVELPCLVMEKIHGPTLEEVLERHPQGCPEEWVTQWLHQALDILRELHRRGIVHRDIKPSNLMLRSATAHLSPSEAYFDDRHIGKNQLVMIDFGGAKQIGAIAHGDRESTPRSNTRLVSPGYSPPEQIVGAAVGPPADFYALGRTCIHLLTGTYPAELEDPMTGELRWRHRVSVSSAFAELLDRMVHNEFRDRPQTATDIQAYLFRIARMKKHPRRMMSFSELCLDLVKTGLIEVDRTLWAGVQWLGSAITALGRATVEVTWETGLAASGGMVGAAIGLILAYWSPLGELLAEALAEDLPLPLSNLAAHLGAEMIVLGLAGLGTALGLTDGGGFDQRRRYGRAALTGALGYVAGGALWRIVAAIAFIPGFRELAGVGWLCVGIATGILTWGLGFASHRPVYAIAAAAGTAAIFWGLGVSNLLPPEVLQFPTVGLQAEWQQFRLGIAFVGLLGCAIGLCLGGIHYLIVPILRWLGWR
ncbi:serine/threonine-protein kinase [Lyngbya sp. CCY1209]|uniref:serine/threonine protein kinase n=1 Tax=Lyngbya sp. CCY1209 TaxID=2886103 RepID=UPI002D20C78B|nr:serine/threonine-protein kinase [Lyngbya sp. CCY1209]MEB3881889.1 serine/threonine protein kinase [Lyngbya sp. CCY1209]